MYCTHCGNANRDGANFCKSCGNKLTSSVVSKDKFNVGRIADKIDVKNKIVALLSKVKNVSLKRNYKVISGAVIVLAFLALSPFAHAQFTYSKISNEAQKLFEEGSYNEAWEKLNTVNQSKLLSATKNKLADKIIFYLEVSKNEEIFKSAKTEQENGNLSKAKELLTELSNASDYPRLPEVLKQLTVITEEISEGEVAGAKKEADDAANRAKAESESRQRAEQAASKSAAQAAANQAAANAAQQQAAQNAAAAETAAQQHAQALRTSFRNEVVDAYNTFNQAYNYYVSGIKYSNNGESLLAINQMSSAKALLARANNNINDIGSRFSGLPSNYYTAAGYMISALNSLGYACDLVVETEGTSVDYSSTINSNKNSALNYLSYVKSFLNSN